MIQEISIWFLLGLLILNIFALLLFSSSKNKKINENLKNEGALILKISENFKINLENLIEEEIKKNIAEIKKEIENIQKKSSDFQNELLNQAKKEIEEKIKQTKNDLKIEKEQIQKAVQNLKNEIEQLQKESFLAKKQFLIETKAKMEKLDSVLAKEFSSIKEISLKIQEHLLNQINTQINIIMTGVEQEVFRLRQETQEKIKQKLEKADQEIQNYRDRKIQEINQKIYQLLGKIAKKILGKSINLALHEELVKEILTKSKEEIFKDYE